MLSSRGQGTVQARALCCQVHTEQDEKGDQGDVESLLRLGFRLLVVAEGDSDRRHDGVDIDNFLRKVGNLC